MTGKMAGVVFETARPLIPRSAWRILVRWLNDACDLKRLHPLLIVAVFTVVFLDIHPFQDGNGRLSRVLTTLLLLQAGYPLRIARERDREQQGRYFRPCAKPGSRSAVKNRTGNRCSFVCAEQMDTRINLA